MSRRAAIADPHAGPVSPPVAARAAMRTCCEAAGRIADEPWAPMPVAAPGHVLDAIELSGCLSGGRRRGVPASVLSAKRGFTAPEAFEARGPVLRWQARRYPARDGTPVPGQQPGSAVTEDQG